MRLIGTLDNEQKAQTFSHFLDQKKIAHLIEVEKKTNWEDPAYGTSHCTIWIYDEDYVNEVSNWLNVFKEHPEDPLFSPPSPASEAPLPQIQTAVSPGPQRILSTWEKQPMGWITKALLGICCLFFMVSQISMPNIRIPERYAGLFLFTSPIEKAMLYDYPKFYELIERFLRQYGYEELEHPADLPADGQRLLQQINRTPYWPGYYQLFLKGGWQAAKKGLSEYPSFEKIGQGQIWRLITPVFLHADFFHILFNMLWLVVLGKQIEQRLTTWRYLFFVLIIGIVSNTAQYLTSGPNFIGFSGILCGMLAFIWMRQKVAAWEGYQLDRLTLIFMLLFVLSMAGMQLISFILEKSFQMALSPNIANMAHLTGGIMGFLLGKMNVFNWRHA